jgi:hypothetical protein
LDISLRDFSLCSCPQPSLKVLLLLNPTCFLKILFNCEQYFYFFILRSELSDIRISCDRISDGILYLNIATFFKDQLILFVMSLSCIQVTRHKQTLSCLCLHQITSLFASVRSFCDFLHGILECILFQ